MSTTKTIKDYLHLYLGCKMIAIRNDDEVYPIKKGDIGTLVLVNVGEIQIRANEDNENWNIGIEIGDNWMADWFDQTIFKPILRPLSDMTEEEKSEAGIDNIWDNPNLGDLPELAAEVTIYLLTKHFDLFSLIPVGLAIDSTTLKATTNEQ